MLIAVPFFIELTPYPLGFTFLELWFSFAKNNPDIQFYFLVSGLDKERNTEAYQYLDKLISQTSISNIQSTQVDLDGKYNSEINYGYLCYLAMEQFLNYSNKEWFLYLDQDMFINRTQLLKMLIQAKGKKIGYLTAGNFTRQFYKTAKENIDYAWYPLKVKPPACAFLAFERKALRETLNVYGHLPRGHKSRLPEKCYTNTNDISIEFLCNRFNVQLPTDLDSTTHIPDSPLMRDFLSCIDSCRFDYRQGVIRNNFKSFEAIANVSSTKVILEDDRPGEDYPEGHLFAEGLKRIDGTDTERPIPSWVDIVDGFFYHLGSSCSLSLHLTNPNITKTFSGTIYGRHLSLAIISYMVQAMNKENQDLFESIRHNESNNKLYEVLGSGYNLDSLEEYRLPGSFATSVKDYL